MQDNGILRYSYNLFAFPEDYFEKHTAEELKITESERQQLIKMKKEGEDRRKHSNAEAHAKAEADSLKEFEEEFFSE